MGTIEKNIPFILDFSFLVFCLGVCVFRVPEKKNITKFGLCPSNTASYHRGFRIKFTRSPTHHTARFKPFLHGGESSERFVIGKVWWWRDPVHLLGLVNQVVVNELAKPSVDHELFVCDHEATHGA